MARPNKKYYDVDDVIKYTQKTSIGLLTILGEMHSIVGRAWCYDRWMYTLTTDDLTCNNNY